MTIEKGADWGSAAPLPPQGVVVRSDHEANVAISAARRVGQPMPPLGLLGGDLCRTLGGLGDEARLRSADAMTFPVDLGVALVDGRVRYFVAHLIARRPWWRGRAVAVMNAQYLGPWDLGPRSHPDDGLLDITDGSLPLGQRLQARSRARAGAHLPHPALHTSRVAAAQFDFAPPLDVWIDGERLGRAKVLSVRVEPDALTVVV